MLIRYQATLLTSLHLFTPLPPRCGPCKVMAPVFAELSTKYKAATFLKVNVDECHNSARRYEVSSTPMFLFFKNREKVHMVSMSIAHDAGFREGL